MKKTSKPISLVTGASSGLGKAIAELLADKGHRVYITARREKLLKELKTNLKKSKGEVVIIPGDLSDHKFREKLFTTIIKQEGKIDYLINNAGYGRAILFENQIGKDIHEMFEVNVVAYQHLAGMALREMKKTNSGKIINIGSVVAFTPLPYFTTYNATKAAIYMFNRSLRYELKDHNISSTVVLPARMKTGFAKIAYNCYPGESREDCVEGFNKIAGNPYKVAQVIIKHLDKGKEVITPTIKSKLWYLMRYFSFITDFAMKNFLGPKELEHIEPLKVKKDYMKK